MAMKRPANIDKHRLPSSVITPLVKCAACGIGSLSPTTRSIAANCIDFNGVMDVKHEIKECCRRECRAHHSYNFVWLDSKKVNTLRFAEIGLMLFITGDHAFSKRFLQYHAELDFRAFVSARAVADVFLNTLGSDYNLSKFHKLYSRAITYFNAMQEFEVINEHKKIVIQEDLLASSMTNDDSYMHVKGFLPSDPTSNKEVIVDGHTKVHMKTGRPPKKRSKFHLPRPAPSGVRLQNASGIKMLVEHIASVSGLGRHVQFLVLSPSGDPIMP